MHPIMISVLLIAGFGAVCAIGGYLLATHIHAVANAVASAASRAVTVPNGDVVALNKAVSGLGDKIDAASADLAAHVTATVNSAVAALPQPEAAQPAQPAAKNA